MYIAGSYDDMQGGICYGGIAHAGPVRYQRAMWFDGGKYVVTPIKPIINGQATIAFEAMILPPGGQNIWPISYMRLFLLLYTSASTAYPLPEFGVFVQIILSWNGTGASDKIYYDGVLQTAVSRPSYNTPSYTIKFGSNNLSTVFCPSCIRECRYYDRQISDAEALALYQGNPPTPTAYWKGNGNTDDAWRDQIGTAHGTVIGSPDPAYIRGDGKVIVNGEIKNP